MAFVCQGWQHITDFGNWTMFTGRRRRSLTQPISARVIEFTEDRRLLANTRYYFRVRAWNSGGNSAWSNVGSIKTNP